MVVPGFNESKYLASVLSKLKKRTKNIIYVDDGSSDYSATIAHRYTSHVLVHGINLGKGAALKTGCNYAFDHLGAQAVIFFDSDDQHNPNEIKLFYEKFIKEKAEVVFGVRSFSRHMPLSRIIGNKLTSAIILVLFGRYIPDIPSGFKGMTKEAYKKVKWKATDYAVETEIAARVAKNKIKFVLVPIKTIYHDLERGMNFIDILRMITQIISWRLEL